MIILHVSPYVWRCVTYGVIFRIPIPILGAADLIKKLLVRDYTERLSIDAMLQHPWVIENASHLANPLSAEKKRKKPRQGGQ